MQRIYLPSVNFGDTLILDAPEIHHQITRVMRARIGHRLALFDGKNPKDYIYEIAKIDKRHIYLDLALTSPQISDLELKLHLYQALPNKLDKLEYVIQKSCEIGYRTISAFPSKRSQKPELIAHKSDRLQKIAIEAIEQCGGGIIPRLTAYQHISEVLSQLDVPAYYCHTKSLDSMSVRELSQQLGESLALFVGPEGGWDDEELELFYQFGVKPIHFGNRILRTETVAPVLGFALTQI